MRLRSHIAFVFLAAVAIAASPLCAALVNSAEPPVIPVGLDAYRMWDQWPVLRIGQRAYMTSTYDRRGNNEAADASHFLYQLADDRNVTLDVMGQGVLVFARYNHWHGSPWHYIVDGRDNVVRESSSADPEHPVENSVFIPEKQFPNPLTWTWSQTKGADLMWVPIPFEQSFRMAYERTHYGTGYYIYHKFAPDTTNLSRPIKAWSPDDVPSRDVLDLLSKSGTDIAPKGMPTLCGSLDLSSNERRVIADIAKSPSVLRALKFSAPATCADAFSKARLLIYWDGNPAPSVDAPVNLFFGAGSLYNRESRKHLVKAFPVNVGFNGGRVDFATYFPMPFMKSAKIVLADAPGTVRDLRWSARFEPYTGPANWVCNFHATYVDHGVPTPGKDLVLLDTTKVEGGGDWCGHFVGTSFIFSDRAFLGTLEGDPRFFFDDSNTPQAQGTGTEEWGGGGDYWGGRTMTLPFAGHPVGARSPQEAKCDEDKIQSAYRFLLADLMPFGKNARIQLEHGGENNSTEHYRTVAYWYGLHQPCLKQTDTFHVSDPAEEKRHEYVSPTASPVQTVTSRYEWGPDTVRVNDGSPSANPTDYAEIEFEAEAGVKYTIWALGRNLDSSPTSDASWLQFDEDIGTSHVRPSCANTFGFGNWLDKYPANTYAWSSGRPQDAPLTITFDRSGKHRLRIQPRHGRHNLAQIWLSPTQATLPEPGHKPTDGIVLNVADASTASGTVRAAQDDTGSVLEIGEPSGLDVYPATTDTGRFMTGASTFTLKLDPKNIGVLLRRKLDYSFPNQCAKVSISDVGPNAKWHEVGMWYTAGSNTVIYSNPPGELGATQHNVQTSNRRWRDDEFLLPRKLTEGRSAIRVKVEFVPRSIPLYPGHRLPQQAWSEYRYAAYCYVMPRMGESRE